MFGRREGEGEGRERKTDPRLFVLSVSALFTGIALFLLCSCIIGVIVLSSGCPRLAGLRCPGVSSPQ